MLDSQVERNNKIYETTREAYEKNYEKKNDKYGLNFFKEMKCQNVNEENNPREFENKKLCFNNREFFITPKNYKNIGLRSNCTPLSKLKNGGCIVNTYYKRKAMTYIFRRNQLHQWKKIDSDIRSFLDKFLVEESTSDQVIYTRKQGEK